MPLGWKRPVDRRRDLRIDWLRGLAMTCVIVDHSRLWSLLSWFTYERFWIVTAAEVFVVLSGVVLGTVYGAKLLKAGWLPVLRGLGRRVVTLYAAFLAVTISLLLLSASGVDVRSLTGWDHHDAALIASLDPLAMNATAWRNLALMRFGPWPFEIVGLYVWLVAVAPLCLLALRAIGWRALSAASWGLYLWYRITPHALTTAEFETTFPILAWQLLFVHGMIVGYHRDQMRAFVNRVPKTIPILVGGAAVAFVVLALCNPWADGPSFLRWSLVSPERFEDLYFNYFALTELGIGRILNLAVALPVGYVLLTWTWTIARPFGAIFVTLGQQSLAAFVLQVYAVLLVEHLTPLQANNFWVNTLTQIALVVGIVALLKCGRRLKAIMTSGDGPGRAQPPRARVFDAATRRVRLPRPPEPAPALPGPS